MSEIRTGSKPAVGPAAVAEPVNPPLPTALVGASVRNEPAVSKADCSRRNFSWFSSRTD